MTSTAPEISRTIEDLTLSVTQEIHVRASLEVTFAALLEQLGPHNDTPEGKPLPMKLEPWPGGRFATSAVRTAISGDTCKPSRGRRCWNSAAPCSCPIP
jgi:hypothetical protein